MCWWRCGWCGNERLKLTRLTKGMFKLEAFKQKFSVYFSEGSFSVYNSISITLWKHFVPVHEQHPPWTSFIWGGMCYAMSTEACIPLQPPHTCSRHECWGCIALIFGLDFFSTTRNSSFSCHAQNQHMYLPLSIADHPLSSHPCQIILRLMSLRGEYEPRRVSHIPMWCYKFNADF